MSAIEERPDALRTAIAERATAERAYEAATAAASDAIAAYADASERGEAGEEIAANLSRTGLAQSEARDALFAANNRALECADVVVASVAGDVVVAAVHDYENLEPSVVGWREARNALALDASARLPTAGA